MVGPGKMPAKEGVPSETERDQDRCKDREPVSPMEALTRRISL